MITKFILVLFLILSGIEGFAQFPCVVQNTSGSNLTVYSSAGSGSITSLASNKRLVAFSQSGNYYRVYLPTDGINSGSLYFPTGYILKSGMTIDYNTGYVQLTGTGVSFRRDYNTPGTALSDRVWIYPTSTGDYEFAVTDVNGTDAKFAVTSQQSYGGYTRYKVDLTQNCYACVSGSCTVGSNFSTQNFGWLSGQFCTYIAPNPCSAVTVNSSPSSTSVSAGSSASFTVTASGTMPITYQWQFNLGGGWNNLTNGGNTTWTTSGTTSTLSIANTTTAMSGYTYRCVLSNACSSNVNSSAATLTITSGCTAAIVAASPNSTSVLAGSPANFTVTASGTTPITYQWQVNSGGGWSNLTNSGNTTWTTSGATSTLSIANTTTSMSGYTYRCVLSNACSSNVNSNTATLTVTTSQNGVISGTVEAPDISDLSGMVVNNTVTAMVKIFNAGSTTPLNTTTSTTGGNFSFSGLASGNYDIEASVISGGITFKTLKSSIQSGTAGVSIKLSSKVIEQISNFNYQLSNLDCFLEDLAMTVPSSTSYNMTSSNNYINSKRLLNSNYELDIEALLRLAMAERMLLKYYDQARTMSQEFVKSADEFAKAAFDLVEIVSCSPNPNIVLKELSNTIIDCVSDGVKLWMGGSTNKIYFEASIDGTVDGLKAQGIPLFSIYNTQRNWIHPLYLGGSLKNGYIKPTLNLPNLYVTKAQSYDFTGSLQNTVSSNNALLYPSQNKTADAQGFADGLRNSPMWLEFLYDLSPNFACVNPYVRITSAGLKVIEIAFLGMSISKSVKRTIQLANEVHPSAVNSYYKTNGIESNVFNKSLHEARSINTANAVANFEVEYFNTINELSAGNYSNLTTHIGSLVTLNNELNEIVRDETQAIKSALYAIPMDDSALVSSLKNTVISSPLQRAGLLLALSYFNEHQNEQQLKDSVLHYSNLIYTFNSLMLNELDFLANSVSGTVSQPYIVIKHSDMPIVTAPDTAITINLKVKNYGSTNASNVYLKMEISPLASFSKDSVFIGSLLAEEEKDISFTLYSSSIEDSLSFYVISIHGDSILSDGKGGATLSRKNTISGIQAFNNHVESLTVYPNPNNGKFRVSTEVIPSKTTYLKIYSSLGQLIYSKEVFPTGSKFDETISIANLPNGVYSLQMLLDGKQFTKKIIIQQ